MKNLPISTVSNQHIAQTRPRQTALPASRRFASELKSAAVQGAGSLLRVGGAVMGAALPAGDSLNSSAIAGTPVAGSPASALSEASGGSMMDQSMELLSLQQQIQMENQRYTMLSNVLKARHETNKNAISNLR